MNKILIICPSRNRPQRLEECIIKWKAVNSNHSDFLVVLDKDNENIYERIPGVNYKVCEETPKVRSKFHYIVNKIAKENTKNYKLIFPCGDDYIMHTQDWDKIVINKCEETNWWSSFYAIDGLGKEEHATHPIISSKIIDTLGFVTYPTLGHLFTDLLIKDILDPLGLLKQIPEIMGIHYHPYYNIVKFDDTYNKHWNQNSYQKDANAYYSFPESEKERLRLKLKTAMTGH